MMDVYINSLGRFLPGAPISNDAMEDFLGVLGERGSRVKHRILKENGIVQRFYALDKNQKTLIKNSEMAARAVEMALERAALDPKQVQYLAAATSQADYPLPGFGSQVHSHLEIDAPEIASFQSICSSSMMAIKGAYLQIKTGEARAAVACASEMPSRLFKASRFKSQREFKEKGRMPYDTEFLRWMLSDGAGACVLQDRPREKGPSLKVEWIDIRSFANKYPMCMYVGPAKSREGNLDDSWLNRPSYEEAAYEGFINLRQDVRLLPEMVKIGVEVYFDLISKGRFKVHEIDYLVAHYSSEIFKKPIQELMERGGGRIPQEKWFTNLHTKGNTGAASILIMLEELFHEHRLTPGQKILCMVPESGRFIVSFMLLTVVGEAPAVAFRQADAAQPVMEPQAPVLNCGTGPHQQKLVRELTQVWIDFEREINRIPLISRLKYGGFSVDDYRLLLKNLRAQVVEGSQWITRAASNLSDPRLLELRSVFIHHAKDEHRDYRMLEKDFTSVGGSLDEITGYPKNIGSEALSAWMFQRASRENPVDLLGAMFIIEGLGNRMAYHWGSLIRDQLALSDGQVSFLLYHGENDPNHFERLEQAINSDLLTEPAADAIVKTAKVTARLYRLQLEELGNI